MNSKLKVCITLLVLIVFAACRKDKAAPPAGDIRFAVPANFPQPVYAFENNAVTKNGFELGRNYF